MLSCICFRSKNTLRHSDFLGSAITTELNMSLVLLYLMHYKKICFYHDNNNTKNVLAIHMGMHRVQNKYTCMHKMCMQPLKNISPPKNKRQKKTHHVMTYLSYWNM